MKVKVDMATIKIKNVKQGEVLNVEGTGYLECRLTFISEGSYKVLIKTENEEITVNGKGLSRILLSTDSFTLEFQSVEKDLKVVLNNIKDYFFDILSEN
ncbi:MAG: hypothetical protein ACP5G3_01135 [Sulfurihydrogenibium sp.]|jgi:hypothetical protein|uniref:Uncharacterized protein n=1 Tax=Sulfurihydrogenibium azorense TaxID=309806 RepID=A0A831YBV0_9AQUI|nr:MAG: hypothetical protein C0178_04130 [Sulfurihydrogenibium sp.]HEV09041.1 hypothetical protein [Sulfurihydrogenibium azorense]